MNAKHTPGPWDCQVGHSDWGMPTAHIIVPEGETGHNFDTWIAEVHSVTPYCAGARKDRDRAQAQLANARLIAAAPDLLAALKNIVNSIEVRDDRAVSMALDAILKAEGEHQ